MPLRVVYAIFLAGFAALALLVTRLGLYPMSIGYGIVLAVLAALAIPATLRATVRDDRIRC